MNLVVRAVLGLRQWATPQTAFVFAIVGALCAIEVLGREHAATDLHDLLALSAIFMIALAVLAHHRRMPLDWLDRLGRPVEGLARWIASVTFQIGLDMRGSPPVKRGLPPIIRWVGIGLAVAAIGFFLGRQHLPHDVRAVLMKGSYLVYLALLAALWFALLGTLILTCIIPVAMIHDNCIAAHRGPAQRSPMREMILAMTYFGGLFILGTFVPLWVAPALSLALFCIYVSGVVTPGRFAVQILWRPRNSIKVRSLSWGQWVACEFGLIGLAVIALTFASCGAKISEITTAENVMPLTSLLGISLAWLGPGFMMVLCIQMLLGRWRDPARLAPPLLAVRDHGSGGKHRHIARYFRKHGWRVTFAAKPRQIADATIELVSQTPPRLNEPNEWPLVLTPDDLNREGLLVRLNRRSEIQRRRRFFTGLESLLKEAATKSRGGSGYWLSPHFWFVTGLVRDGRPDDDFDLTEDTILTPAYGQPYHRVFPRPVRRHLFEVLRAVQIDLIFIEDGVRFKRLRRVLRALFEVYDVHAGRKPAEEIDFRGLPGTRVMIHDFQFDDPFQSKDYPEPKYDLLGRARILHVFRDRGGEEADIEAPFDFGRTPAPAGLSGG